jgi:hypothetical protein
MKEIPGSGDDGSADAVEDLPDWLAESGDGTIPNETSLTDIDECAPSAEFIDGRSAAILKKDGSIDENLMATIDWACEQAVERLADLLHPGLGTVIHILAEVREILQDLEAIDQPDEPRTLHIPLADRSGVSVSLQVAIRGSDDACEDGPALVGVIAPDSGSFLGGWAIETAKYGKNDSHVDIDSDSKEIEAPGQPEEAENQDGPTGSDTPDSIEEREDPCAVSGVLQIASLPGKFDLQKMAGISESPIKAGPSAVDYFFTSAAAEVELQFRALRKPSYSADPINSESTPEPILQRGWTELTLVNGDTIFAGRVQDPAIIVVTISLDPLNTSSTSPPGKSTKRATLLKQLADIIRRWLADYSEWEPLSLILLIDPDARIGLWVVVDSGRSSSSANWQITLWTTDSNGTTMTALT